MLPVATVADFKLQFTRDFKYGVNKDQVQDADIQRALVESASFFNPVLWDDTTEQVLAQCYCAAHFLYMNIQAAGGLSAEITNAGFNPGGSAGAIGSKSVGPVSLTYVLPPSLTESAIWSEFLSSKYGIRYAQMTYPRTIGGGYAIEGFQEDAGLTDNIPPEVSYLITGNFDFDPASDVSLYGQVVVHYMFTVQSIVETSARFVVPVNQTFSGLTIVAGANTLNGNTTITLMKNGVATTLSAVLNAGVLTVTDPLHTVSVATGDTISLKIDITPSTTGTLTSLTASLKTV